MFSGQHFAILAMFWRLVLVSCSSSLGLCLLVLYLCLVLLDWVSGFWFSCFCVLALWLLCLGHSDLTPAPFRWRLCGDLPGGWLPPPHLQGQGRLQGRQPGQRQHEAAPQVRRKGHPSSPLFFLSSLISFFSFLILFSLSSSSSGQSTQRPSWSLRRSRRRPRPRSPPSRTWTTRPSAAPSRSTAPGPKPPGPSSWLRSMTGCLLDAVNFWVSRRVLNGPGLFYGPVSTNTE